MRAAKISEDLVLTFTIDFYDTPLKILQEFKDNSICQKRSFQPADGTLK